MNHEKAPCNRHGLAWISEERRTGEVTSWNWRTWYTVHYIIVIYCNIIINIYIYIFFQESYDHRRYLSLISGGVSRILRVPSVSNLGSTGFCRSKPSAVSKIGTSKAHGSRLVSDEGMGEMWRLKQSPSNWWWKNDTFKKWYLYTLYIVSWFVTMWCSSCFCKCFFF